MTKVNGPGGVGGWLWVLCALLLVWQPLSLGLVASGALDALVVRGLPAVLFLLVRLLVTGFGIAAGLAIFRRRPAAATMAKASLAASAATDVFVYVTPYFPSNRIPGETPIYIAATIAFYGGWIAYLSVSKRVANTLV